MQTWGVGTAWCVPVHRSALVAGRGEKRPRAWGEFRRSSRGMYVPKHVSTCLPSSGSPRRARWSVAPAAVTGWGAMAWLRSRWFNGLEGDGETPRPVPIAQPRRLVRPQSLMTLCEERFDHREVNRRRWSAHHRRCALDLLRDAVRKTSSSRGGHPQHGDLQRSCVHRGSAGMGTPPPQLYAASTSVDGRYPSLTRTPGRRPRLRWCSTGQSWSGFRPLMNRPVFDLGGRHIGTPDAIDPRTGVIGEYDGPLHLTGARRAVDLKRQSVFEAHGLFPVTMVTADRRDQSAWQERVRAAYARAERTPATERRWTLSRRPGGCPPGPSNSAARSRNNNASGSLRLRKG